LTFVVELRTSDASPEASSRLTNRRLAATAPVHAVALDLSELRIELHKPAQEWPKAQIHRQDRGGRFDLLRQRVLHAA